MINTEEVGDLADLGFDETNLKHLVLAENYKHFSRPLKEPMAKEALNRENLEYLYIYKWNPYRIIISDIGEGDHKNNYAILNIIKEEYEIEKTAKDESVNQTLSE